MRAVLGMYPFPAAWPAYQEFWAALARRVSWLPPEVESTDDVHGTWERGDVVFGQVCGYPAAAYLRDKLQIVGAFAHDVNHAEGHRYRSVLVANRPGSASSFTSALAAANSEESLSGYVSLTVALYGPGAIGHQPILFTGSHRESLAALRRGEVEIASIDGLTLTYLIEEDATALDGLHVIGIGPLIPSPALYTSVDLPPERVAELRQGLADTTTDPSLRSVIARLHITGFVPLDMSDYDNVLDLIAPSGTREPAAIPGGEPFLSAQPAG
jgi:ABC-type phosphate/phosphonate transport system substrate-binding protein